MRTPRWERPITSTQPRFASHLRSRNLEELCSALLAFVAADGRVRLRSDRADDVLRLTFEIHDISGFNAAVRERLQAIGWGDDAGPGPATERPPEATNVRPFPQRSAMPPRSDSE